MTSSDNPSNLHAKATTAQDQTWMLDIEKRETTRKGTAKWLLEAIACHSAVVNDADIGVDWADAKARCWRCGDKTQCQKCHIVPKSLGGSDEPHNLVALCPDCHDEAPNVTDPAAMWLWMQATQAGTYDQFWTRRAEELAHQMEPRLKSWQQTATLSVKQLMRRYREQVASAGLHWSQKGSGAKMTIATRAWLLLQIWRPDYDDTLGAVQADGVCKQDRAKEPKP